MKKFLLIGIMLSCIIVSVAAATDSKTLNAELTISADDLKASLQFGIGDKNVTYNSLSVSPLPSTPAPISLKANSTASTFGLEGDDKNAFSIWYYAYTGATSENYTLTIATSGLKKDESDANPTTFKFTLGEPKTDATSLFENSLNGTNVTSKGDAVTLINNKSLVKDSALTEQQYKGVILCSIPDQPYDKTSLEAGTIYTATITLTLSTN